MKNKIIDWLKADYYRAVFAALSVVIAVALPTMSKDAGMSGDEHFHFQQAENVVNFYKTFGKDTSAVVSNNEAHGSNLYAYGQLPDNISYLIAQIFNIEDILSVRHLVNSFFGFLGILFAGLLAFKISGSWFAAIITALLLFFSPRYLGHSFNNLKDLPFAAIMMMGVYYITCFFQTFPKPPKRVLVMLAVSIGLALAIRVGGLLLVAYFGLFGLIYLIKERFEIRKTAKNKKGKNEFSPVFIKLFKYGIIISLAGYVLGVLLWPYALISPIANVKETFLAMSNFETSLRQIFEGSHVWSDYLPWYYVPKYILITIPTAVLIGLVLFFSLLWKDQKNYFWYFIIFFAFFFPIFWIAYSDASVYGGWRHALFAYPPMAVAAGLGFGLLMDKLQTNVVFSRIKFLPIFGIACVILFLWHPIRHTFKNHPYQYVYFNKLVGGTKGAFGNYEQDYYYHSTRKASEWVIQNAQKTGLETTDKIKVASWHSSSVQYFFRHDTARFQVGFSRWREWGNNDWDYAIFTVTGMSPDMLKSDAFPPVNTVHQIKVDGVPIAVILKRTDKSDYLGYIQKQEGNQDSAIVLLRKALTFVSSNEAVLSNLGEIFLQKNQLDSAIFYLNQLLAFDPKNETANYLKAYALMFQNRLDEAQIHLQIIVNHNPKNDIAPWLSAQIYAQQGNLILMERMLERSLIANAGRQEEAFNLMQRVYQQMGFTNDDATRAFTRIWINVLEKLGYKEDAERLRTRSPQRS
jgi:tetratricopeptide (TPR) repeat protein